MSDFDISRREVLTGLGAGVGTLTLGTGTASVDTSNRHIDGTSTQAATDSAVIKKWPSFQYNSGNTGGSPDASGPAATSELEFKWSSADLSQTLETTSPVVDSDTVYVTTHADGGALHALNSSSGDERWRVTPEDLNTDRQSMDVTGPVLLDDTVYAVWDNFLYAIATDDGSVRWSKENAHPEPVLAADNLITERIGNPVALSPDGTQQWELDLPSGLDVLSSYQGRGPALAVADGSIYAVGDSDSGVELVAIDAAEGTLEWRVNVPHPTEQRPIPATPTATPEYAFVTFDNGTLHAVDTTAKEHTWSHSIASAEDSEGKSSPAVAGDTVYVGGGKNMQVHAVAIEDGSERWTFEGDWWMFSSPIVVGDTVYIVDHNGKGYGIDRKSGSQVFSFEHCSTSTPAIQEQSLYCNGSTVHAFAGTVTEPSATFTVTPTRSAPGEAVTFDASDSNDSDGTIRTYEWDVDGDGSYETTGRTVTHTFSTSGDHTVTLRVTDDSDTSDTAQQTVTVSQTKSQQFSGAAAQYNKDGDDEISISELGAAAADYARGDLTISELGEVAAAYARS